MGHHRLKAAAGASPADPYFSSTSLLLLGNGTNGGQNNTFVDSSANNFTITRNGNTTQGSFSPFTGAGGSGYFDGSGDYLSVPSSAALEPGSGDFTIELWFYPTRTPSVAEFLIARSNASGFANFSLSHRSANQIEAYFSLSNTFSTPNLIYSSTSANVNAWNHVAFVKSGLVHTLYLNGVNAGSTTAASNPPTGLSTITGIGDGGTYANIGYMSSLRILKGTALYSGSTIAVPTSPLTAITNTSLLLNFTNAGILDSTAKNDLETVGDAQISTSVKKFGTGSIYFDGTGDTLSVPPSANLSIGTGNFTLEGWIYPTSFASVRALISFANNNVFYFNTSGIPYYGIFGVSDTALGTTAVTTSVWTHVAFVRNGSTLTCYLNGSSVGSTTTSSSIGNSTDASFVGSHRSANYWIGYIDDLRITKGVARYTSNFTQPSAQLPAR